MRAGDEPRGSGGAAAGACAGFRRTRRAAGDAHWLQHGRAVRAEVWWDGKVCVSMTYQMVANAFLHGRFVNSPCSGVSSGSACPCAATAMCGGRAHQHGWDDLVMELQCVRRNIKQSSAAQPLAQPCRLVYHCLLELAAMRARGIVEHSVLLGAPVRSDALAEWRQARAVVAGRLVNGFSSRDWVREPARCLVAACITGAACTAGLRLARGCWVPLLTRSGTEQEGLSKPCRGQEGAPCSHPQT